MVPIIKLWSQLLVPVQGDLDDEDADRLLSDVLRAIEKHQSTAVIIDLSGVWLMDSHLCSVMARVATAARFMGARCVLCGLSPEIVATLQTMGVQLRGIETKLSLEDALEAAGIVPVDYHDDDGDTQQLQTLLQGLAAPSTARGPAGDNEPT